MRLLCPMYLFWQQIGRERAGTEKKVGECKCHVQLIEFVHFYHVEIDPETRVQIHVQVCTVLLVNPYILLLKN